MTSPCRRFAHSLHSTTALSCSHALFPHLADLTMMENIATRGNTPDQYESSHSAGVFSGPRGKQASQELYEVWACLRRRDLTSCDKPPRRLENKTIPYKTKRSGYMSPHICYPVHFSTIASFGSAGRRHGYAIGRVINMSYLGCDRHVASSGLA